MKILQNGYPKSGNYWLYKILDLLLDAANVPKQSYIQSSPIYPLAKTWSLSYPEQAGLDVLDIEPGINSCRIASRYKEPLDNLNEYINKNRLVWSHSRFIPDSNNVYDLFDKVVYIIRDPRDAAISMSHFAFTPYRQQTVYYPYSDPEEYLRDNLGKHLAGWCQHVGSHILAPERDNMHIIFYENLKNNFDEELVRLIKFLEFDITDSQIQNISEAVTVNSMKKKSHGHVRKGVSGGWKTTLTKSQVRYTNMIIGSILKELGYPTSSAESHLPTYPKSLSINKVRSSMRRSMVLRGYQFIRGNSKHLIAPDAAKITTGG